MTVPRRLTFLLISDIHFGPSAFSADFALKDAPPKHLISGAAPMKTSLIEALSGKNISLLLASGDLTSTGSPSELEQCSVTVLEMGSALGIRNDNIFFTFGNHDVDWKVSSLATGNGGKKDPLYTKVAAEIGGIFVRNPDPYSAGPLPGCAVYKRDDFVLIVANTGYYCSHAQEYRHGILGMEQLKWLERSFSAIPDDDLRWRILLLHHHPQKYSFPTPTEDISCLQEGSELLDLIGKSKVDIVCHGHRHHPYLCTMMLTVWMAPVTFLCAGSLAVNVVERRHGEIPNLCHVVNLESRNTEGAANGNVLTYKYTTSTGWTPVLYSPEVPLDGNHRFGSIATEAERRRHARDMMESLGANNTTDFIDLPVYNSLPFSLQCLPVNLLNSLIREIAMKEFSRKVLGLYPNENVVLRK
jgi:3',5'-cyclic AMP phosphodiesterase CpdA